MSSLMKRGNGHDVTMPESPTNFTGLVDRLFQDNLNRFFHDDFWGFPGVHSQSNVPVNVRETDKDYRLELVAPGLKKEDFHLDVSDDMLTISFEHKEESNKENKDEGWLRKEYRAQSFSRNFNLDDTVDANKITAEYHDGILRLMLPKKEGARRITRSIEIK
jgi:HSP20 family protein